ncbi:hypothetical protein A4X13_0g334 [Tilletia indica]|uniref:rRNA-processing protein EFG1 n=1 Tax=Tilletia indica TaxID=43049 RepID=A0A177TS28_9BASI|nr:hypothetical protein A4X13_0g334 [Tilletia indica]
MAKDNKGKGKAAESAAGDNSARGRGAANAQWKKPAAGHGQNHNRGHQHQHQHQQANVLTDAPAPPGLNKLKAALRQTKRLLAREDLNPETKQEAERKLIALEEDIQTRGAGDAAKVRGDKNKKMSFFDSVKATRKIPSLVTRQEKLEKELASGNGDQSKGKADLEEAKSKLQQFRVILNYTLHWPATETYIRFNKTDPDFDPTQSQKDDEGNKDDDDESGSDDEEGEKGGKGPTRKYLRRIEVARSHREWVEKAMATGEISNEPEKQDSLKASDVTGSAGQKEKRPRDNKEEGTPASKRPRPTPPVKARKPASEQQQQQRGKGKTDQQPHKKHSNQQESSSAKKKKSSSASAAASAPSAGGEGVENDDFFDT